MEKRHYRSGWYFSSAVTLKQSSENKNLKLVDTIGENRDNKRPDSIKTITGCSQIQRDQNIVGLDIKDPVIRKKKDQLRKNFSYKFHLENKDKKDSWKTSLLSLKNKVKISNARYNEILEGNSKRGKSFWRAIMFIVLAAAFIFCGAIWPEVYVVLFGLTGLLILVGGGASRVERKFIERVYLFLLCILLALFYYWLFVFFPIFLQAILMQLILFGAIGLISLIAYLVKKK